MLGSATRAATRTSRRARAAPAFRTARDPNTRTTRTAPTPRHTGTGDTPDPAYTKSGWMARTPELGECETAAGGTFCSGGSGFTFPDDEGKVDVVLERNLDFARNVAATPLAGNRP